MNVLLIVTKDPAIKYALTHKAPMYAAVMLDTVSLGNMHAPPWIAVHLLYPHAHRIHTKINFLMFVRKYYLHVLQEQNIYSIVPLHVRVGTALQKSPPSLGKHLVKATRT